MNFGYIRVSTADQNTARQEEMFKNIHIDRMFVDKVSGKDMNRPELKLMMDFAREGDTIYCPSVDRLGRSASDLFTIAEALSKKGVALHFIKDGHKMDNSPMGIAMFQIAAVFAQFERAMSKERQREGIAEAKKDPTKYLGRKPKLTSQQELDLVARVKAGECRAELAREYGLTRASVYNILNRLKGEK